MSSSCSSCSTCASASDGCRPESCGHGGCHAEARGISHPILVLSGKGGVGKSTVAVHLARALAARGARCGLLDADVHGPSVPRLLGLSGQRHQVDGERFHAVPAGERLHAASVGFLVDDCDQALIWRGPAKTAMIQQFIRQCDWGGPLDALVVDLPPGTGDEALAAAQGIPSVAGVVVVTTPQAVATDDVRRSLAFCTKLSLRVLGIVENFAGYACPSCGAVSRPFAEGGGAALARAHGVPLLASLPLDPAVLLAGDRGEADLPSSPAADGFAAFVDGVLAALPTLIPTTHTIGA